MGDPLTPLCLDLLEEMKDKNMPTTLNFPNHKGVVFAYAGENWELFANAIRQAVDRVQERLLESKKAR